MLRQAVTTLAMDAFVHELTSLRNNMKPIYDTTNPEMLHRYSLIMNIVRRHLPTPAGHRLLELGCHYGELCEQLTRLGYEVHGVDAYSPNEPYAKKGVKWKYTPQDLNVTKVFPEADGTLDGVLMLEVLEHLIDTDRVFQECHRVLKPGGLVAITTPNINMLKNRLRVPLGLYPYSLEYKTILHHVRLYNRHNLHVHLREHGFRVVVSRGTHLVPQRMWSLPLAMPVSNLLARAFPYLSSNLVVAAVRV